MHIRTLFLLAALALSGCQGAPVGDTQNTSLSPREQMVTVLNSYGLVLAGAAGAIDSGALPADAVEKIAAGTHNATDAVKAATDEAIKCWRDEKTGVVGDAPNLPAGQHCDPKTSALLLGAAQSAVGNASGIMSAFGINTGVH